MWAVFALFVRIVLPDDLYQLFHEGPDGRLQPFVIEDAHIKCLMPVFDGDKVHIFPGLNAVVGHHADAHPGGYQIQSGLGGVHGADDVLVSGFAAGQSLRI